MGVIRSLALVIPTIPNDVCVAFWACLPLSGRDVADIFVYRDTFLVCCIIFYSLLFLRQGTGDF